MKTKVNKETGEINDAIDGPIIDGPAIRPVLRSAYDDHMPISDATGLRCEDESLASQSSAEEADINVLVRRFGLTGQIPAGTRAPFYGDFTGLKTPHEMAQALVEAQASFMAMPAEVRSKFDNDPHRFVDFCSKDENYDQICDWGMLAPEPMEKRIKARKEEAERKRQAMVDEEIAKRQAAAKPA